MPGWPRDIFSGVGYGGLSIFILLLIGYFAGAYTITQAWTLEAGKKCILYLLSGLVVGVIEEILFRGALFALFRKAFGFWFGAIFISLIFSAIHFAKPIPVTAVVYGHWYTGLELIPDMFRFIGETSRYFPFMLTLFVMSMIL